MKKIDINADLGEGANLDSTKQDVELMNYITSANIACGQHAGNYSIMRETVKNALEMGVAVGAHPGYADRKNFGRKSISLSNDELEALIKDQVLALKTIVETQGGKLKHIKPHGALYNDLAKNYDSALIVAAAIKKIDSALIFVGLANSNMINAAQKVGLSFAREVFADRAYLDSGLLVPRSSKGAVLHKPELGIAQVKNMIFNKMATSINGKKISIEVDTVCIHGDNAKALDFARLLNSELRKEHVALKAMGT